MIVYVVLMPGYAPHAATIGKSALNARPRSLSPPKVRAATRHQEQSSRGCSLVGFRVKPLAPGVMKPAIARTTGIGFAPLQGPMAVLTLSRLPAPASMMHQPLSRLRKSTPSRLVLRGKPLPTSQATAATAESQKAVYQSTSPIMTITMTTATDQRQACSLTSFQRLMNTRRGTGLATHTASTIGTQESPRFRQWSVESFSASNTYLLVLTQHKNKQRNQSDYHDRPRFAGCAP